MVAHVDSTLPRAMCTSRARYCHVPRSFLVCVLSLWLTLSAAQALDPNKRLTQYAHTAWRIQDGFFPNTPFWVSQTKDGYLWLGGLSGAMRFDGIRFTPWSAPIASTPILHPVSVRAGEFWIATQSEFAHVKDNVVISHYDVPVISDIHKDSDGSVWALSYQDPDRVLCQATDTKIRCFGKAEGITIHVPSSFISDGKGGFWIGGDTSLLHWKMGAASEIYSPQHLQSNVGKSASTVLSRIPTVPYWSESWRRDRDLGLKDFAIAPAYFQTVWFRSLGAFLFLAVLTVLYRLRLRHLERQRDALRKSEKELRDVIDTIPAIVWSALPDGSNAYVNRRFIEYSGLSAEQTAGSGWQAAIHPDDLERHAGKWREAVATGTPHENEVRFRRSDGQYRWQLDRGVPLRDEDGNIVKWYGVVTDIEDRKRAEVALQLVSSDLQDSKAKLEEAQRITHVGYWEWDLATNRIKWSDETYRIYGMRPQERAMDLATAQEKIHPEDWQRGLEAALGGGARFNAECRVFRPTGEVRIAHFQGDVKRDESGRPYRMFGTVQDITDRKHADEALQQSQLYLAEGQRLAHMGSWAFNAAGFEYWSSELFRIHGLDPSNKPPTVEEYLALVHPEDRAFMKQGITNMLADHRAFDFTKRIVRSDGEIRHVRCVGVPVTQRGIFQGFLGTGMDVTEQERLTEELRLSEQYLSEGQRLAHMGSWAFNPSGLFEYWSQELFKIYGLDPQKRAPTLEEYLATLHPQDRESMAETIKTMHAERCGCDVKKRIVRPDGEQRYIRCVGIPVVEGEVLKGFLGTAIDITAQELLTQELKRQQAHLTEAQKLTHTGSWAWRVLDRNVVEVSEEFYRIYGFDPAEAPTREEYFERVHPEDRLKWRGITERAIVEKADYDHEFRILLPNGKVKWIRTVGHPVLSDIGDLEGFVGSSTDITELKSAEQEREKLRQLEADLAHIDRVSTLGEMAASLAHEIKQPIAAAITSANSCIEWLAHEPPNLDRARAAAARIDKYGNRAVEIIDRMRSFYKKSPPQRELVDVNGIIHEMLTLLKGEATRSSIAMRTDLSAELPKIMVDRVQLQQVFMNLMLNGIEAMEDRGGELTVKSELQDGQPQFSVSDTGVGLPTEKMDQIFSAFFTTKPQGSGMGLAISRSIVESHGGQLWASANSGGGATFNFTLPIQVTKSSPLVA
jgi:PAS domain S-box-containing protein